jgi:hypothetical protein
MWVMIAMILWSAWFLLSPSKNTQPHKPELKEINLSKEANEKPKGLAARTIPIFIASLTVSLKGPDKSGSDKSSGDSGKSLSGSEKSSEDTDKSIADSGNSSVPYEKYPDQSGKLPSDTVHVLYIPTMGVIVGAADSEKVIRYMESSKEFITQKLVEKLAKAEYEKLLKIDGEVYLKKIILDSISGDATGTDKIENYPLSSAEELGHYGAVDVLLPESYTVH